MPLPESPPQNRLPFEPPPNPPAEMVEFWALWRQEKFWACHEALEDAWRPEPNAGRKDFLRGLIHGAVATFQARRGNAVGAARQLARARARLAASLPAREGVDVARFVEGVEREVAPLLDSLSEAERDAAQVLEAALLSERAAPARAPEA